MGIQMPEPAEKGPEPTFSWMASIRTAFDGLVSGLNAIGTAWIFVIMLLINADVWSRAFLNQPISGIKLVIEMSIIAIVFLQLAAALRGGRMTRSDVLIGRLLVKRPQLGHSLQALYHLGGAALMVILYVFSEPLLAKAWRRQTFAGLEGDFTLPIWPLKLLIMIGAAVCAIQFLRHIGLDLAALRGFVRDSKFERPAFVVPAVGTIAVGLIFYSLDNVFGLSAVQVGIVSIFFVLFLVYIGVHVGVALALLSFVCV